MRTRWAFAWFQPVIEADRAIIDRPALQVDRFLYAFFSARMRTSGDVIRRERLGRRDVGLLVILVMKIVRCHPLKGGSEVKDDLTVLTRSDPPIGKTAAIEIAHNGVVDWFQCVSASQEIAMERMGGTVFADCPLGGSESLSYGLAAKDPFCAALAAPAVKTVRPTRFHIEQ